MSGAEQLEANVASIDALMTTVICHAAPKLGPNPHQIKWGPLLAS